MPQAVGLYGKYAVLVKFPFRRTGRPCHVFDKNPEHIHIVIDEVEVENWG